MREFCVASLSWKFAVGGAVLVRGDAGRMRKRQKAQRLRWLGKAEAKKLRTPLDRVWCVPCRGVGNPERAGVATGRSGTGGTVR